MTCKPVLLGKLCTIEKGTTGIMKAIAGPYPMVTLAEQRTSHNEYQFDAKAVIVPLISSTGHGHASMKRVHYQEGKFALGSILCALIPNDETQLNARFLHNYLSFFKESLLVPLMRGAANVSLSIKSIAGVLIPLPPLEEQLAINELVDAYSRKTKTLQAELQTQQTLLAQLRQAILQEAVQGKLTERWRVEKRGFELSENVQVPGSSPGWTVTQKTETGADLLARIRAEKAELIRQGKLRNEKPLPPITDAEKPFELPEGWVLCRLGELSTKTDSGWSPACNSTPATDDNWGVLKTTAVQEMIYLQNENKELPSRLTPKSQYQVEAGDILITRAGPKNRVGVCCVVKATRHRLMISDKIVRIHLHDSFINSNYIELSLNIGISKDFIESKKTGMADSQVNITQDNLKLTPIPLPPLSEQQAIVTQAEQLLKQVNALETENKQQQVEVGQLMQAVLREAFAGKETAESVSSE